MTTNDGSAQPPKFHLRLPSNVVKNLGHNHLLAFNFQSSRYKISFRPQVPQHCHERTNNSKPNNEPSPPAAQDCAQKNCRDKRRHTRVERTLEKLRLSIPKTIARKRKLTCSHKRRQCKKDSQSQGLPSMASKRKRPRRKRPRTLRRHWLH